MLHRIWTSLRYRLIGAPAPPGGDLGIWGWWQGRNLGDNWIRRTLAGLFPEAQFVDTYFGDFARFKFMICGGGGLFVREVHKAWHKAPVPVPFGVLGLGAEFPHPDHRARELAAEARFFFARDIHSADCMHLDDSCRSYDLTFSAPLDWTERPAKGRALLVWRDPNDLLQYEDFRSYIGPAVRHESWEAALRSRFDRVAISDFSGTRCPIEELTDGVEVVVSARYHGLAAAIQRGLPCIGIDLCPKNRQLLRECDLEDYCLKVGEVDRLGELVERARRESERIRDAQRSFAIIARSALEQHVAVARAAVAAVIGDVGRG